MSEVLTVKGYKMKGRLVKNARYLINFIDDRQLSCTWYSGPGTFVRKWNDDFEEKEPHYLFHLPNGDDCVFPKSSVIARL